MRSVVMIGSSGKIVAVTSLVLLLACARETAQPVPLLSASEAATERVEHVPGATYHVPAPEPAQVIVDSVRRRAVIHPDNPDAEWLPNLSITLRPRADDPLIAAAVGTTARVEVLIGGTNKIAEDREIRDADDVDVHVVIPRTSVIASMVLADGRVLSYPAVSVHGLRGTTQAVGFVRIETPRKRLLKR